MFRDVNEEVDYEIVLRDLEVEQRKAEIAKDEGITVEQLEAKLKVIGWTVYMLHQNSAVISITESDGNVYTVVWK